MIDFSDIKIPNNLSSQRVQSSGAKKVSGKITEKIIGTTKNKINSISKNIFGSISKKNKKETKSKTISNASQINKKKINDQNNKSNQQALDFSPELTVGKVCETRDKMFLNKNQKVFADCDKNEILHVDPEAFSSEQEEEFNNRVNNGELVKGFYDVKKNEYEFKKTKGNIKGKINPEEAVIKFNEGARQDFKDNLAGIKNKHKEKGNKAKVVELGKEKWDSLNSKYDRAVNALRSSYDQALIQNGQEEVKSDKGVGERREDFRGFEKILDAFLGDFEKEGISDKKLNKLSVALHCLIEFIDNKTSEERSYKKEARIIEKFKEWLDSYLNLLDEIKNKEVKTEGISIERLLKDGKNKLLENAVINDMIESFNEFIYEELLSMKPVSVHGVVGDSSLLAV